MVHYGGDGGNGLVIDIKGTEEVYGGGGGGGTWDGIISPAYSTNGPGLGGGATLTNGTFVKVGGDASLGQSGNTPVGGSGVANTGSGGGGGGSFNCSGGSGSDGIVIIKYTIIQNDSSININNTGSGGGGYLNKQGSTKGIKWDSLYSYLNEGANGSSISGGGGGW